MGRTTKYTEEERIAARRASYAKYAEANREKLRAAGRKYYAENKERMKEYSKARKIAYPEKVKKEAKDSNRKRYALNAEKYCAAALEYARKNPQMIKERKANWDKNNKAYVAEYSRKHREINLQRYLNYDVKNHLAKRILNCSIEEIPQELLDAKIAIVNVKRKLKEIKNENTNRY